MNELLARGLTTIFVTGGLMQELLDLRERLESGEIVGPRMLTTGPGFTAPDGWPVPLASRIAPERRDDASVEVSDPMTAQDEVRRHAQLGVDAVKIYYDHPDFSTLDDRVLDAILIEAEHLGLATFAHTSGVEETMRVARSGIDRLVHSVRGIESDPADVRYLRDSEIAVSTTVSFETEEHGTAQGVAYASEAERALEQRLNSLRYLWDEDVLVAFGTDSPFALGSTFMTEVRALSRVFAPSEIVASMTKNAAEYMYLSEELGTLEQGKVADLLVIDGDPLVDVTALEEIRFVIQNGRIVFDSQNTE